MDNDYLQCMSIDTLVADFEEQATGHIYPRERKTLGIFVANIGNQVTIESLARWLYSKIELGERDIRHAAASVALLKKRIPTLPLYSNLFGGYRLDPNLENIDFLFNQDTDELIVDGNYYWMSPLQAPTLSLLMRNADNIVTHEQIADELGYHEEDLERLRIYTRERVWVVKDKVGDRISSVKDVGYIFHSSTQEWYEDRYVRMNMISGDGFVNDEPRHLSPTELKLFKLLSDQKERIILKEDLCKELWPDDEGMDTWEDNISAYTASLREKLSTDDNPQGGVLRMGVGFSYTTSKFPQMVDWDYEFERFKVHYASRMGMVNNTPHRFTPNQIKVLQLILPREGELVQHEELYQVLEVENSPRKSQMFKVSKTISGLRDLLGESKFLNVIDKGYVYYEAIPWDYEDDILKVHYESQTILANDSIFSIGPTQTKFLRLATSRIGTSVSKTQIYQALGIENSSIGNQESILNQTVKSLRDIIGESRLPFVEGQGYMFN